MTRFNRFALATLGLATVALYGGRAAIALRDIAGPRPVTTAVAEAIILPVSTFSVGNAASRLAGPQRRHLTVAAANPLRRGTTAPTRHPLLQLVDASGPLVPTIDSAEPRVEAVAATPAAPRAETPPAAQPEPPAPVTEADPAPPAELPAPTWSAHPVEPAPAMAAETSPPPAPVAAAQDTVPAPASPEHLETEQAPPTPTWTAVPVETVTEGGASEIAVDVEPLPAPGGDAVPAEVTPPATSVATVAELMGKFREADYRFEDVAAGRPVPRIIIRRFPPDLRDEEAADARKMMFLQALLPIVLYKNQEIRRDRDRLLTVRDQKPEDRSERDAAWLERLYSRYRVESGDMAELVERVDVIPPSLALAQAATESGWGTSRSAREGNALFGQYADDGETYAIRSFDALLKSAQSYALNLNTHRAYRAMRAKRAELHDAGKPLDGYVLAATLNGYSELGKKYVRYVRRMIKENRLSNLDQARLVGEDAALAAATAD